MKKYRTGNIFYANVKTKEPNMKTRADGKTAVTILLNEQDVESLRLIMEADSRETMADCIRAIVRSAAKNFCPERYVGVTNKQPRTKRAAANQ